MDDNNVMDTLKPLVDMRQKAMDALTGQRMRDIIRYIVAVLKFFFRVAIIVVGGMAYTLGCLWYLVDDDVVKLWIRVSGRFSDASAESL